LKRRKTLKGDEEKFFQECSPNQRTGPGCNETSHGPDKKLEFGAGQGPGRKSSKRKNNFDKQSRIENCRKHPKEKKENVGKTGKKEKRSEPNWTANSVPSKKEQYTTPKTKR